MASNKQSNLKRIEELKIEETRLFEIYWVSEGKRDELRLAGKMNDWDVEFDLCQLLRKEYEDAKENRIIEELRHKKKLHATLIEKKQRQHDEMKSCVDENKWSKFVPLWVKGDGDFYGQLIGVKDLNTIKSTTR